MDARSQEENTYHCWPCHRQWGCDSPKATTVEHQLATLPTIFNGEATNNFEQQCVAQAGNGCIPRETSLAASDCFVGKYFPWRSCLSAQMSPRRNRSFDRYLICLLVLARNPNERRHSSTRMSACCNCDTCGNERQPKIISAMVQAIFGT